MDVHFFCMKCDIVQRIFNIIGDFTDRVLIDKVLFNQGKRVLIHHVLVQYVELN
jgi:hypothetical protein